MKKLLLLFVAFALTLSFSEALAKETELFKVLAKQGDVQLRKNNRGKYKTLRTGSQLFKKDYIRLQKGAYLALLHVKSGKTMELKKAGKYRTSSLSKKFAKKSDGINTRFANYVLDEMTEGGDLFSALDKGNMDEVGAVTRHFDENDTESRLNKSGMDRDASYALNAAAKALLDNNADMIKIKLPRSSYLVDDEVEFVWFEKDEAYKYDLHILDENNNEVFTQPTTERMLTLNLDEIKLKKGVTYYWYVSSGEYFSEQYQLYRMTDKESAPILNNVGPKNEKKTAIENILLGSYYEDLNIMNRAVESYAAAVKSAPTVVDYKKVYAKYLYRIGLYDKAKELHNEVLIMTE